MWKFREIQSSSSRVDRALLWTSGTTRPKNWRIQSNISEYTRPIFAIFSPNESAFRAHDGSVPYFSIYHGRCHVNQTILREMRKSWRCTNTTCFLCTSVIKRTGVSISICARYWLEWLGYIWYKFGGLLTSTSRAQVYNRRRSLIWLVKLHSPGGARLSFATTC